MLNYVLVTRVFTFMDIYLHIYSELKIRLERSVISY
jgi:hypothetical protein